MVPQNADGMTARATEHDATYQDAVMAVPHDVSDMDDGEECDESELSESDFDLNDDPQPSK